MGCAGLRYCTPSQHDGTTLDKHRHRQLNRLIRIPISSQSISVCVPTQGFPHSGVFILNLSSGAMLSIIWLSSTFTNCKISGFLSEIALQGNPGNGIATNLYLAETQWCNRFWLVMWHIHSHLPSKTPPCWVSNETCLIFVRARRPFCCLWAHHTMHGNEQACCYLRG